ncbi:predicted protein [Uncinocarpus reesii 1704]|uniref:Ubiquitin-like protease family profile domain-containing protein n=1 Tax=Uncinocarpus reesii (strain UAMH 1704) TaxID=336963 RepID=C4JDA0_UNCRE|nr:uncharacterized protein UREG_00336 [Uncinocarpus reesii 1704]EEP75490.1 predicted protein [Uncinocarpus reesii 1704]
MGSNAENKRQNDCVDAPQSPPRRRVVAGPMNLTIAFPTQPASAGNASQSTENASQNTQQQSQPNPVATSAALSQPEPMAGQQRRGRARRVAATNTNEERSSVRQYLLDSFVPLAPRASAFKNGHVPDPETKPQVASQEVNREIPSPKDNLVSASKPVQQPSVIVECPKYSPPRAIPITKPESDFVSPTDPVALGRLMRNPGSKRVRGEYNPSTEEVKLPTFNPAMPNYGAPSKASVAPSVPKSQVPKPWDFVKPYDKDDLQAPNRFANPSTMPSDFPQVAPLTTQSDRPELVPSTQQSELPPTEPQGLGVNPPRNVVSGPQNIVMVQASRQAPENVPAQVSAAETSMLEGPMAASQSTEPLPPQQAATLRLNFEPAADNSTAPRSNLPSLRAHLERIARRPVRAWKHVFPRDAYRQERYEMLRRFHREGDIFMLDAPKPSLKRSVDEMTDPMQNEIEAGRATPHPDMELDIDPLKSFVRCVCGLREPKTDDSGDVEMQGMPGQWPVTPPRPALANRFAPNGSDPSPCNPVSAQSIPDVPQSPIRARSQRNWVFHTMRIFGTVKRQVTRFCKACVTPCRSCPPPRKFMTWCDYRAKLRDERRNKRKPRLPIVHVEQLPLPTVPQISTVMPPPPVSRHRSRKSSPISRPVRKDKVPSYIPKSKSFLHGVLSGRVTKANANWKDRSMQCTNRLGPRRVPTPQTLPEKNLELSMEPMLPVRQEDETKVVAWFAPSSRPNLPSPKESLPVQPETPTSQISPPTPTASPTAVVPPTAVEVQGVADAEPMVATEPSSSKTPEEFQESISQPEMVATSEEQATESAPAEPVRESQPPRTKKHVHWIASSTPQRRPISSVNVFDPQAAIMPKVQAQEEEEDSIRPAERPSSETRQPSTIRPLSAKWESKVETALSQPDSRQLGTTLGGDTLTRRDFATCATPLAWLNDEIINAYLALVIDYARRSSGNSGRHQQPKYHAFNTFFYSSLRDKGYESVRRWATRAKIGGPALLRVETVFVPIHHHAHWTLMVVKPAVRTIEHFDSLGGSSSFHVAKIKEWIRGELGDLFVEEEWRVLPSISPQQNNGSDCGVFLLTTAKLVAFQQALSYGPKDIPAIRKRIVAELMNGGFEGDFDPKAELPVQSKL